MSLMKHRMLEAAFQGRADIVAQLIEQGADVNAADDSGNTALHIAACNDNACLVELLISKGARTEQAAMHGLTPLFCAILDSPPRWKAIKCLLDGGANVDAADDTGSSPLIYASVCGYETLVELLLLRGAEINHAECGGRTALHGACDKGHIDIVKLLVQKGADIHQVASDGMTPLQMAALVGHGSIVDYLLKRGADFEQHGTATAKVCKLCGKTSDAPLQKCVECRAVSYCSRECQLRDWKEGGESRHKVQCALLKEQRDRNKQRLLKEAVDKNAVLCGGAPQ